MATNLSSVSRGELKKRGNSLMVQWFGLHAFTAGGRGLIPRTKFPQISLSIPKKKKKVGGGGKRERESYPWYLFFFFFLIKIPDLSRSW